MSKQLNSTYLSIRLYRVWSIEQKLSISPLIKPTYMKRIFNKRFWSYFFITFIVTLLLIFLYILFIYTSDFYPAPIKVCLNIALTGTLVSLSSALSIATAISSFVAFRYVKVNGRSDFLRLFATAASCFFTLSIGLYVYDSTVSPRLNIQPMSLLSQLRTGEFRPAPIEDDETSSLSNPNFEDISPMTFSYEKLQLKIDSLKKEVY